MKTSIKLFLLACIFYAFNISEESLPDFILQSYSAIPGGSVQLVQERNEISVLDSNETNKPLSITVHTDSFYIAKHEVSNAEYNAFLNALKKKGDLETYKKCKLDSTGWMNALAYSNSYVAYYHLHKAYENHPVVNVSYEGAKAYCAWLTETMAGKIDSNRNILFRLPTMKEWLRASKGDKHTIEYAWQENDVEAERANRGNFKVNANQEFVKERNTNSAKKSVVVGTMNRLKSSVSVTKPTNSYFPNEFGLYNLNGNVAEMIHEPGIALGGSWADDIESVSFNSQMQYKNSSPYVGFRPVMIID